MTAVETKPDIGIEVGVAGLKAEIGPYELLEVGALFPLRLRGGAVLGENRLQVAAWHGILASRFHRHGKIKMWHPTHCRRTNRGYQEPDGEQANRQIAAQADGSRA